eukprot:gene12138-biopygen30069
MSLRPEEAPPPPSPQNETLIQYNLRNKVCAYCKRPGALLKCEGCRQRSYCDRKCQKRDWKQEHRGQCVKLQQVFVPPPPGWRGAAAAEASGGGGGGSAGAAGGGGAPTVVIDEEDEIENPCPICLDNEDDATVDGNHAGRCSACGQCYCGACKAGGLADRSPNCPTCRALLTVSDDENFTRYWKLVHDRSPGRHTLVAQHNLANMYGTGRGVEQDYVEAAKWQRKAAEAGFAHAQCSLGYMYGTGRGVEQDHVEAVKWFRKSAEAGHAKGQCNLGNMYNNGKGVEQDYVEAAKWYRTSAEAGFAPAQCILGYMYNNGEGVKQDQVEAAKWYRTSAEAGFATAQNMLGTFYYTGKGVEQDHVEAAKWYRKAAEAGHAKGQYNLGIMYSKGKGVEQDFSKAVRWLQLAGAHGHETALKILDAMQQANIIPTPLPGTAVTTVLLTSAKAAKYTNRTGRVAAPTEGAAIKQGRAAVLLDGEAAPISFKLMNLQLHQ